MEGHRLCPACEKGAANAFAGAISHFLSRSRRERTPRGPKINKGQRGTAREALEAQYLIDDWQSAADQELAEGADSALHGHALAESMRRLRVSVDQLRASSDTWARRLSWLTAILIVLNAVLILRQRSGKRFKRKTARGGSFQRPKGIGGATCQKCFSVRIFGRHSGGLFGVLLGYFCQPF